VAASQEGLSSMSDDNDDDFHIYRWNLPFELLIIIMFLLLLDSPEIRKALLS
jgi:hypothetical protein